MLRAWWNANIDPRREISLLMSAIGLVLLALSVAASALPLVLDGSLLMPVGSGTLGAAAGGYLGHRSSGSRRALRWALIYGISTMALVVGMFATAALLRPTVEAVPWLGDAWAGLFAGGCLVGFSGALLWERDPRRRGVAAGLLLALGLIVSGTVVSLQGGPWTAIGLLILLAGLGLLLRAAVGSALLDHRAAARGLWPRGPAPLGPTHPGTP